jgi:hypothetical protein
MREIQRPTEEAACLGESLDTIKQFLRSLKKGDFTVAALMYDGMSQSEIGRALGKPRNSINVRFNRIKEVAKTIFGEQALEGRAIFNDSMEEKMQKSGVLFQYSEKKKKIKQLI